VFLLGSAGCLWTLWRRGRQWTPEQRETLWTWLIAVVLLSIVPPLLPEWLGRTFPTAVPSQAAADAVRYEPVPITSLPLFGYGTLVLTGFLTAKWVGERRAERAGLDPLMVFDLTFWTLLGGVVGGRLFYVIQYADQIFKHAQTIGQKLFAAINLSGGGLVLIGAMLGGAVAYFGFARSRRLPALAYLDLLTPSIFIGEAFGRLGCLMYGCCFGDACQLPWSVTFGPGSAAFETLQGRGYLSQHALETMPLHPTQVYMSLNAALLALVTYAYYPYRVRTGQVFAVGMILYALTRFFIEFVRADELGQLGTGLTISQLLSLAIAAGGALLVWRRSLSSNRNEPPAPPLPSR